VEARKEITYEKIIEEVRELVKKLLPTVSSRKELSEKLAKILGIAPSTANRYIHEAGIKTGFPRGFERYWEEVRAGKREAFFGGYIKYERVTPLEKKSFLLSPAEYKIIKYIESGPKFGKELIKKFGKYYYHQVALELYRKGIIKRLRLGGEIIYYFPEQKFEALERIKEEYPKYYRGYQRVIRKELGISEEEYNRYKMRKKLKEVA